MITISLLSACGYQLKGTTRSTIAGAKIHLQSANPYGKFEKTLSKRLKLAGIELSRFDDAASQLHLLDVSTNEQGVSRDASGRASESVITMRLSFQVVSLSETAKAGALADQIQSIEESTNYTFDYRDPVARKNQRIEAEKWLSEKLAERMLSRLERQIAVP